MLLTGASVYFVDWPHARVGAPWVDIIGLAPSVTLQGGPAPERILQEYDPIRYADPQAVTAVLASIAGFFVRRSLLPEVPGLPGLRQFQAAQGAIAVRWLAERTGWT